MFDLFGNGDSGIFGKTFDLDFDGRLDAFERTADFGLFMEMVNESENENDVYDSWDDDEW